MQITDVTTLSEYRSHQVVKETTQSPDLVIAMLSEHKSVLSLQEKALTDDIAAGLLLALNGAVTVYDVRESSTVGKKQRASLSYLVSIGAVTQDFVDAVINYSTYITYPYANATLTQFNIAKGIYTEKEVAGYAQHEYIKITLIDTLPEDCIASTVDKEVGFEVKNFGKHEYLKVGVNAYKLRTDRKKAGGKLIVKIPLENFNFTVGVV